MNDLRFADAGIAIGRAVADFHYQVESVARASGRSLAHPSVRDDARAKCDEFIGLMTVLVDALAPGMTAEQRRWVMIAARREQYARRSNIVDR